MTFLCNHNSIHFCKKNSELLMHPCRFKEQQREEFELFGPSHPGEILREEILPRLQMSRRELAAHLNVSYATVSRLLTGRRRVSPELAVALAQISGTSALYWLVLQAHRDAWRAEAAERDRLGTRRGSRLVFGGSGLRGFRSPLREPAEVD